MQEMYPVALTGVTVRGYRSTAQFTKHQDIYGRIHVFSKKDIS